jgi:copper chaperone CopZ
VARVNNALSSLPWVEEHNVDFNNKTANIVVNGDFDQAATINAITELGFSAEIGSN